MQTNQIFTRYHLFLINNNNINSLLQNYWIGAYETRNGMESIGARTCKNLLYGPYCPKFTSLFSIVQLYLMVFLC